LGYVDCLLFSVGTVVDQYFEFFGHDVGPSG
jgi:hypothetical protein